MIKINLEDKIPINNLCSWDLYFPRLSGVGDIKIPANAKNFSMLTYNEMQMQIQSRNTMIIGTNEVGEHARIKIANEDHYKALFNDSDETVETPKMLTLETVKELLAITGKSDAVAKKAFEKEMKSLVQTSAEKKMLLELAKTAKAENVEAWKITAMETYTDLKFN